MSKEILVNTSFIKKKSNPPSEAVSKNGIWVAMILQLSNINEYFKRKKRGQQNLETNPVDKTCDELIFPNQNKRIK